MPKRSLSLCFFFISQVALAQPAPAAKPVAAKPPVAVPPVAAAPVAPPGTPAPVAEPALPQVTDDMLAPVPPAANVLQSWRDALRLLRQNSSTLRTLEAEQDVARAQARTALAPAL